MQTNENDSGRVGCAETGSHPTGQAELHRLGAPRFDPARIASVSVFKTYESCERHTFYVRLTNGEGFSIEPMSYATGSVYTNHEGLSIDEARDRALIDAADWADFFGLSPEPYLEDGKRFEPLMTFNRYTTRRAIAAGSRRAKMPKAVECEASQSGPKASPKRRGHADQ